jgi:hypothetical protein
MIGRRGFLLAGSAAMVIDTARAALPVPAGGELGFDIMREGAKIGTHVLNFTRVGAALKVAVAVDIVVSFGPIVLYRYKHRATVDWDGEMVASITARTNDDGTPRRMSAQRDEGGLVVEGSRAARYVAPAHSLPGTHWDRAMLDAPFINTEDGRLMSPTVTPMGWTEVAVTGGTVRAQQYHLTGDVQLDTYYAEGPAWVGLRFQAHDGSEVRYLKM